MFLVILRLNLVNSLLFRLHKLGNLIFHPLPRLTDSFEVFLLIVLVHVLLVEVLLSCVGSCLD